MEYNINPIFCVNYVVRIFEIQVVPIRKTVNYPSDASSRLADDACWGGHGNSYDNGKYKKNNSQTNQKLFIHKSPPLFLLYENHALPSIPQVIKDMCQFCKGIINFFLLLLWRRFVVILAIESIAKDIKGTRSI